MPSKLTNGFKEILYGFRDTKLITKMHPGIKQKKDLLFRNKVCDLKPPQYLDKIVIVHTV